MFNSALLDVFIGLAFVYLLLSLVLASVLELVNGIFKRRTMHLDRALKKIVGNDDMMHLFYKHPLVCTFSQKPGWFYSLLKCIGLDSLYIIILKGRPSYLSSRTFALILFDLLEGGINGIKKRYAPILEEKTIIDNSGNEKTIFIIDGSEIDPNTIRDGLHNFSYFKEMIPDAKKREEYAEQIQDLLEKSLEEKDVKKLKMQFKSYSRLVNKIDAALASPSDEYEKVIMRIAEWFDLQMENVTGSYKRQSQSILFLLSLCFCMLLNADTIMMANVLWSDPVVRQAVVEEATAMVKNAGTNAASTNFSTDALNTAIDDSLPCSGCIQASAQVAADNARRKRPFLIGWERSTSAAYEEIRSMPYDLKGWFYKCIGILMTTILVSLGAPFWFDLLSKLVNIRNDGLKPKAVAADTNTNK